MTGNNAPVGEDDLQAFIDDRPLGIRLAMVEAYIADHPEITERVAIDRRYRDALRAQLAHKFAEPIPSRLRISNIRGARRTSWARRLGTVAAAIAIFVTGAGSGWLARQFQPDRPDSVPAPMAVSVGREAVAAYRTFVVEVVHPVEVKASSEAHLQQWLSKRLGRPIAAPDLSKFGYQLMGGRLLPGGSGAAAQFMFDDASGKRLTVYVEAGQETETAFRFQQDGAASTFAWIDQGFGFAVTAVASRETLLPVAESIYHAFEIGRSSDPSQKG
jgi:anti-sigma factor RsiW